jgi:hypothetical protein
MMLMAAVGLIPAVAGALSQELVDLATILNALRSLKLKERPTGTVWATTLRAEAPPDPHPR